jgi:sugar phosphate isomerase/epimerase
MQLTGFSDEAGRSLDAQIRATKELGWTNISARGIDGVNLHDHTEESFEAIVATLESEGICIPEFGSLIGSWSKKIASDFALTLAEIDRAIPRMQRLGTKLVRIMSYAQEPWGEDQHEQERFRRLREIVQRFADAGIVAAHENCMNWGGFSAQHTLRLLDEVPGLKLVFDTGNPVFQLDRSATEPFPWQNALDFWKQVKQHVVHIHIKDCENPISVDVEPNYTWPGDGVAQVREILTDAKASGYDGLIAIEPHVATVFHVKDQSQIDWQQCYDSYVTYGKKLETILAELDWAAQ